jgi:hypothetical protein
MRQMAELQQFQRKVIDLEFKVKTLETSLTEKNAMVSSIQSLLIKIDQVNFLFDSVVKEIPFLLPLSINSLLCSNAP